MSNLVSAIEELKRFTIDYIKEVQTSQIPTFINYDFAKRSGYKFAEEYNSTFTYSDYNLVSEDEFIVLIANGLRFRELQHRRGNMIFKDSLINLIKNDEIQPFLLFLNGAFVKWSNITIIHDYRDVYMLIRNFNTNQIESADVLTIPFAVKYTEKGEVYNDTKIFSFDDYGALDKDGETKIYLAEEFDYKENGTYKPCHVDNRDIVYKDSGYLARSFNYEDLYINPKYKLFGDNIIIFKKNLIEINGEIKECLLLDRVTDKDVDNLNLLTVNNGEGNDYVYKLFYSKKVNIPKNMILKPTNTDIIKHYIRMINGIDIDDDRPLSNHILDFINMLEEFNFELNHSTDYTEAIPKIIDYISNYDISLFNDFIFSNKELTKTVDMMGKEIIPLLENNTLTMIREKIYPGNMDTFVIIFINGSLYRKMHTIKYDVPTFTINMTPKKEITNESGEHITVGDVGEDDIVEFLFVQKAENQILTLEQKDTSTGSSIKGWVIPPTIDTSKLSIYTDTPIDQEFEISSELTRYPVDFRITNNRLYLNDEDYYKTDRTFYLSYKNQFRSYSDITTKRRFKYVLPEDFMYAKDESRYLVFVNGRKVNRANYRIVFPKNTTPFNNTSIYFKFFVEKDEMVDIFYLPFCLDELEPPISMVRTTLNIDKDSRHAVIPLPYPNYFVEGNTLTIYDESMNELETLISDNILNITDTTPETVIIKYNYNKDINGTVDEYGYIYFGKSSLDYPIDKNLYFIFVNGKKVPLLALQNINSTTIKITKDINTLDNLSIMKYIDPVPCITDKFKTTISSWDKNTNDMTSEDLNNLFDSYIFMNGDLEPEENKEDIDNETIINEIVRDYYMKPDINDGTEFLYDYDKTYYNRKDSAGNIIIPTMDATTGKIVKE